jgi:hypothetical protein
MNNFTQALAGLEKLTNNPNKKVDREEYEIFCKNFIFLKLKGVSFAESFCKHFEFNDCFLKNLSDETAKFHIETLGYIK